MARRQRFYRKTQRVLIQAAYTLSSVYDYIRADVKNRACSQAYGLLSFLYARCLLCRVASLFPRVEKTREEGGVYTGVLPR